MKRLIIVTTILCTVVLIIPTMLVMFSSPTSETTVSTTQVEGNEQQPVIPDYNPEEDISIAVYRSQSEQVETVPLEQYVMGVVASEMPVNFELEALKAQALTARTFIIQQMLNPSTDIKLPDEAIVTDTVTHQVYQNDTELKNKWGQDFDKNMEKIALAVLSTKGEVLTYENEPITAAFFSTSNGYTENSEDYWQNSIPYLRSVESPWDQSSPRSSAEKVISITEFEEKLGIEMPEDGSVGTVVARTDGGRVAKVKIGGKEFTGRDIRDRLELDSSDFHWQRHNNQIVIRTRGWGHGVGMSQYGADGMAKEGRTYKDILNHYYQGVSIQSHEPFVAKLTAKSE
ncbi:stage II sporulation protein D [Halalkalibacter urbisdiaboli]|uniref:stage II sporulation protein D n=1 Tax=Halalkalibacter urbisdiaboli TaxID=1960589 RepID=UPI000B43C448|nr:stage II sporulation protein D [Halalkalibacter urbisdiaboli]